MRHIRSWMFVPGYQHRMIDKAFTLSPDAVIFDLEDSVTPDNKPMARDLISEAIGRPADGLLRFVRVNAVDSGWIDTDLGAVVRPGLAGLMIPKVHHAGDIEQLDMPLSICEENAGMTEGSTRLVVVIESARGLINASAIADSNPRLLALMFGAEDFALDLGITPARGRGIGDMLYARSATAIAAAAAGLQAIDRIVTDVADRERLLRDTLKARELGFTGKAIIHPNQIEPVHQMFAPSEEEIAYAHRVIAAYEEAAAQGDGAIALDGRLVDWPIVEQARRIIEAGETG